MIFTIFKIEKTLKCYFSRLKIRKRMSCWRVAGSWGLMLAHFSIKISNFNFAKVFERTNDETELQESYRPKKLCTCRKIGQGIRFWRQKSPSSSKIHRNWWKTSFRHRKISSNIFFRRRKIESCKSSETRFPEVSRRSELSSRDKCAFEVVAASAGFAKRK